MLTHTINLRTEWSDCGPSGRVFYPKFFEWVNPSCHDMLDSGGLTNEVLTGDYSLRGVLLKSVDMDFKQPAHLHDHLTVTSTVERIGETSFTIAHTIKRGDDLIASGSETRLWVLEDPKDPNHIYRERIPDDVRAILQEPVGMS